MTWDVGAPETPDIDVATLPDTAGSDNPPGDPAGVPADTEAPEISEAMVRAGLAAAGSLIALTPLARDEIPGHWRPTDEELDGMAPHLTRWANRSQSLRVAAAYGDPALFGIELLRYAIRNIDLARRYDRDHPKPSLADRSKPETATPDPERGEHVP